MREKLTYIAAVIAAVAAAVVVLAEKWPSSKPVVGGDTGKMEKEKEFDFGGGKT